MKRGCVSCVDLIQYSNRGMHRYADVAGSMLSLPPSQQVSSAYNCPGHGIDDCDACPNRCPTYCPTETLIPCLGEACISAALAASAPLPLATTQATAHIPAQPPPAAVPLQLTPATLPSSPASSCLPRPPALLPNPRSVPQPPPCSSPCCLPLSLATPTPCCSPPPSLPPYVAVCPPSAALAASACSASISSFTAASAVSQALCLRFACRQLSTGMWCTLAYSSKGLVQLYQSPAGSVQVCIAHSLREHEGKLLLVEVWGEAAAPTQRWLVMRLHASRKGSHACEASQLKARGRD